MAITVAKKPDDLQPYTVTRAMCMAGDRVEVGSTVYLTATQGAELGTAGKVTPGAAEAAEPAKAAKATKPAKESKPEKLPEPAADAAVDIAAP